MRKSLRRLLVLGAILVPFAALPARAADQDATRALIKQIETQYQGRTSHAVLKMKIVTASWTRELSMESWSQGRDKFVSRVLSPKKDAGAATLKLGDEIWSYMPKIDRLIKVPTSLMADRWMGSHLTNDDLVKENRVDEEYAFTSSQGPDKTTLITATPKPNAPVVWGKIVYQVDAARRLPVSLKYYDEDGALVRTMTYDDVKAVNGRELPTRFRITPADAPGEYTEMSYETLSFDVPLSSDRFSLRALRK